MISTWKVNSFRDLDLLETAIMTICLFVFYILLVLAIWNTKLWSFIKTV